MDPDCFDALHKLDLPFVYPINFTDLESAGYKALRLERTIAEYCWTVNPLNPYMVFSADSKVQQVTYIDADMWFLNAPEVIFKEFANTQKPVLITEHDFLPQYDQTNTSGQYCAQWITYRRGDSEPLRQWWQDQCFAWCFNRYEDGKFGDQKYLEQWPILFPNHVHVLSRAKQILAPWNADDSRLSNGVVYHFHGLRIMDQNHYAVRANYFISDKFDYQIYQPYLQDLCQSIKYMSSVGINLTSQVGGSWQNQNDRVQSFLIQQMIKNGSLSIKPFTFQ